MDILKYKEYEGTAEIDTQQGICFGKVLFISDLVTYQADSPKELRVEFEAAIEDYIATCAALGIEPKKPCSGQFNVRVTPELHREATLRALTDNVSLNTVVSRALQTYVNAEAIVNHKVEITMVNPGPQPAPASGLGEVVQIVTAPQYAH